jgi:GntR family transcriptional repressor for pyruvate dehydrogenase complex
MHLGRQTLSQAVSAAVLDRIRSGEFGPGDRLPTEKSLMEEYGVGRNSVREAVQALVTLGLVDVRPGRGATVIGIESDAVMDAETISVLLKEEAVDDLYDFRRLLEVEIARTAAIAATDRDLEDIGASIRAFDSALELGRPISSLDDEFHAAVA